MTAPGRVEINGPELFACFLGSTYIAVVGQDIRRKIPWTPGTLHLPNRSLPCPVSRPSKRTCWTIHRIQLRDVPKIQWDDLFANFCVLQSNVCVRRQT